MSVSRRSRPSSGAVGLLASTFGASYDCTLHAPVHSQHARAHSWRALHLVGVLSLCHGDVSSEIPDHSILIGAGQSARSK